MRRHSTTLAVLWAIILGLPATVTAFSTQRLTVRPTTAKPPLSFNEPKSLTTTTALPMATNPGFAVAAITGAISGGFVAGSLHAIAGTKEKNCCGLG